MTPELTPTRRERMKKAGERAARRRKERRELRPYRKGSALEDFKDQDTRD